MSSKLLKHTELVILVGPESLGKLRSLSMCMFATSYFPKLDVTVRVVITRYGGDKVPPTSVDGNADLHTKHLDDVSMIFSCL